MSHRQILVVDDPGITRFAKSSEAFAWVGDGFVRARRTEASATITIATERRRIKDVAVIDNAVLWCEEDEDDPFGWRGFLSPLEAHHPRALGSIYAVLAHDDEFIAIDLDQNQFCSFDHTGRRGRTLIDPPSPIVNLGMVEQMIITHDRVYWSQAGDTTSSACLLSVPIGGGSVRVETQGAVVADLAAGPSSLILARIQLSGTSCVDSTLSTLGLDDMHTKHEIIHDDARVYCPRIHGESVLWMRRLTTPRRAQLVRKALHADIEILREADFLWGLVIEGDDAWFASPRGIERICLSTP